jgi:ABC-2 type transport system ATP-binding protein
MATDPAIRLENVHLIYRVARGRIRSIKEFAIRKVTRKIEYRTFEAVNGVSLRIEHGEVVGLVGRNGAGKSSLLKLIARVHRPTAGRVVVDGRVSPLLELGLGMTGELTGRENLILQGTLLGFTRKEMRQKLPSIVEFAELADFIDAPIRTYSTGMAARLSFAIATDSDPDILLVDEALAVGDERFQAKCRERMAGFRMRAKTVMLVSHALVQLRDTCRRVIWIEEGRVVRDGPALEIIDEYQKWSREGAPAIPGAAREHAIG